MTEDPPWAHWIGPETLIAQVQNTAPFLAGRLAMGETGRLIELGGTGDGFLRILASWKNLLDPNLTTEEQLQDYFALCLACHHATVATFVPTDVDTKIRGLLWRESRDPDVLRPMMLLALSAQVWTDEGISVRNVRGISGHNGEHWSVIAGALGRLAELGDDNSAEQAMAAIEAEIDREQAVFDAAVEERNAELVLLQLAMTLAHNRGDLTQGVSFWKQTSRTRPLIGHLAQRGKFARAVHIYHQTGLSADGHRHYPLRGVKALRRSPATLLPLSPFLDDWGAAVVHLDENDEVLSALITGCKKVPGQQGYYRAMAGMHEASPGGFERAIGRIPNAAQRMIRGGEIRKLIDIPRASFESMMRKRARAALANFRPASSNTPS